ncbi:hypothetical protein A3L31_17335 [Salmonella enterica]|nr:hypothetical protein [Salmonella enterica]
MTPAAKSFVAGTSLPWTTETGCGRVCTPGKSVCGEQAAVRRQTGRDSCAIRRSGLTLRIFMKGDHSITSIEIG